ncbi:N-acetylmuramoyl-L-alanine amidase [Ancylobacter terrae]|uniref:N-acetylmuramoyl-L-alanine amidase n=1 Tax=Ancylobacter sp. sgz301288 TaxID=3342077 RepID=UPI00385D2E0E
MKRSTAIALAAFALAGLLVLPVGAVPARAVEAAQTPAVATDARLVGDEERTRLVIDLSRPVDLGAFTLADPYRVIVDIPNVIFTLKKSSGEEGRGLVSAYRFGLFAPGKGRVVIDARAPVLIDKAFVLDPIDGQPARLVVDLVKTDRETFLKSVAAPVRRAMAPPAPVADAGDPRPLIVLDPGHGGIDSGAVNASAGMLEKDVVLEIARIARTKLEKTGRYRVMLTREGDTFVPLGDRIRLARDNRAALFISLHADSLSARDGDVRGATVYTLSDKASDAEAQRLADEENKADLIAGLDLSEEPSDVAGILFDLAQRETRNFSSHFARTLVGQVSASARMHKSPLKSAGFKVLKAPDVPSVLFELGYMSSKKDLELMTSDGWRAKVTDAMVEAIDAYVISTQGPGAVEAISATGSIDAIRGTAASAVPAAIRP